MRDLCLNPAGLCELGTNQKPIESNQRYHLLKDKHDRILAKVWTFYCQFEGF